MTKTTFLSAALLTAALLTTPAMARQGKLASHLLGANARITTTAQSAVGQTCCRDRGSDFRGPAERDVWGHWGAYYGPMVGVP